jgi:hypothetical protein
VPSLTLVLRALWFRRGVSLAVLLVATITTAAAATGALYLRAGGESVLRDALTSAPVSTSGIELSYADLPRRRPLAALEARIAAAGVPFAHRRSIRSLQNTMTVTGGGARTRLIWRDGACQHVRIVSGHCPTGPHDALISDRAARSTGLRIGQQLHGCPGAAISFRACGDPHGQVVLTVVGSYALPEADPYWFDGDYFDAHTGNNDQPDTLDATFLSHAGADDLPWNANITAVAQYLLDPTAVRLDDEQRLRRELAHLVSGVETGSDTVLAITRLTPVLDQADSDRRDLGRSVLAITLQLVALAFVVLRLVVADASEARGAEVALAKLRGYRAGPTLLLGLLEPVVLLVLAVPLGLLAADVGVRLLGAEVLAADTPVDIRTPSLIAALGALAGGLLAAAYAGRRVLTRPVLEQWRRTGEAQVGRAGQVVEVALGLGAAVALVGLVARGALDEDSHSALPLLVPLLLVLVVALLGVRLLPAVCKDLVRRTRASSRLGPFLAVRTVARRPAGLRLAALLAVAVGLATFAVDGSLIAAGNREERAKTDVGAATVAVVRTEGDADLRTVVRSVDPDGSWAMAAEVWLPFGGLRGSVLAVDSAALPQVAHWRGDFATAPLRRLTTFLRAPAPAPLRLAGDAVAVDLTTVDRPTPTPAVEALVTGSQGQVRVALGPLRAGAHRYEAALPHCGRACRFDGLAVARGDAAGGEVKGAVRLTGIAAHRDHRWQAVDVALGEPGGWHQQVADSPGGVTALPSGVTWRFAVGSGERQVLLRSDVRWPLPVAVGNDVVLDLAFPAVTNFDAHSIPIDPAVTVDVVPQQGREASLVDLDAVRLALPRFEEFATQQVWLSRHAPADAVERLRAAGLQIVDTRTSAAQRALLDRSAPALGLLLFAFAAAAAAVLAAGATAVALYLSGRRRSFELAAMLVVGAARRSLIAAAVGEQLLVLGTALVLGVTGGLASAALVLPAVPEVPDGPPALRYTPHVGGLTLFLVALAAVVVATAVGAAAGLIRHARPRLLREAAP